MSVSNLALLVRQLRKKDRRETLNDLRDPDSFGKREEGISGDAGPNPNDSVRRKYDGEILPHQIDLPGFRR